MLYIDVKYASLISNQLHLFKKKGQNLWNFRCPFCKDSKTKQSKARGYLYKNPKLPDNLAYKCHNCSKWCSFSEFLKTQNSELYSEYIKEKFFTTEKEEIVTVLESTQSVMAHFAFKPDSLNIRRVRDLEAEHWLIPWIQKRQIPTEHYDKLYFAPDFKQFVTEEFGQEKAQTLISGEPRLVIPFYNENKKIIAIQGRELLSNKMKYLTVRLSDDPLIFGLDRVRDDNTVYVVEGPIDSLFLKNAIAVAGLDLMKVLKRFRDTVFVFDNEKYNDTVIMNMKRVIDAGKKIVIWPRTVEAKDVNDYILTGKDIDALIKENTFYGLEAKMKFGFWRK